jgi:hypothetical protein
MQPTAGGQPTAGLVALAADHQRAIKSQWASWLAFRLIWPTGQLAEKAGRQAGLANSLLAWLIARLPAR